MRRLSLRTSIVFLAILSVPVLDACAPRLGGQRLRTNVNGLPVDIGQLGGLSCSSIGIGHRPSESDIDLCKKYLTETQGKVLQILWEEFDEVVADGLHNLDTCPILCLFPLQDGHDKGTISDEDFAKRIKKFYDAKYDQGLDEKAKKKAKARLIAAGLPLP